MTKATDNLTTSISRRDAVNLIVGGAAGVSAYGLVDTAASAVTGDPTFGLIEAHKRAYAEYGAAAMAAGVPSTQEQRDWRGVYLCHTEPCSFVLNGKLCEFPSKPVYLRWHDQIDVWAEREIEGNPESAADIEARRQALHAEYDAEARRLGLHGAPLETARDAAGDVESDSIRAVLRAEAKTVPGLLAQIRYLSKYMREFQLPDSEPEDADLVPGLLDVLAAAIEKVEVRHR
jgi:hypothetical protein